MPRTLSEDLVREVQVLSADQDVRSAVRTLRDERLPALPVVEGDGTYCGIFGEREFVTALFPGYLGELKYAGFVPHSLDKALDERAGCLDDRVGEHCNREHIDVGEDYSDAHVAETFLHHRVLVIPVVESDRSVKGVITRSDFFDAIVARIDAT
jgi:CBS domain-containing protein